MLAPRDAHRTIQNFINKYVEPFQELEKALETFIAWLDQKDDLEKKIEKLKALYVETEASLEDMKREEGETASALDEQGREHQEKHTLLMEARREERESLEDEIGEFKTKVAEIKNASEEDHQKRLTQYASTEAEARAKAEEAENALTRLRVDLGA
jgi:chromosome segregation ATPase